MRNKSLAAVMTVGFISIVSVQARAQAIGNALQVGLGTNFVSYQSDTYTDHMLQANGTTVDYKPNVHNTTWGFTGRNNLVLEGGYGITDSLVLGGLLQFGNWSTTSDAIQPQNGAPQATESRFYLFIAPKIDYMFLPDSAVRPFIGAAIGLVHTAQSIQTQTTNVNGSTNTATNIDVGMTGVGLQLRAGVRWFLTPGFSVDPAFAFSYGAGSGTYSVPVAGAMRNDDSSVSGYTLGLNLALSGWIGL